MKNLFLTAILMTSIFANAVYATEVVSITLNNDRSKGCENLPIQKVALASTKKFIDSHNVNGRYTVVSKNAIVSVCELVLALQDSDHSLILKELGAHVKGTIWTGNKESKQQAFDRTLEEIKNSPYYVFHTTSTHSYSNGGSYISFQGVYIVPKKR